MFKLVGLGMVLVMVFGCCSIGTLLPDLLGEKGPAGPGLPLPIDKLPIPGLGQVEIDVTQIGSLEDVPVYPGGAPTLEKVKIPAVLSLFVQQFKAGLEGGGGSFALYTTSDPVSDVTEWYRVEMPQYGWGTAPGLEGISDGSFLVWEKKTEGANCILYIFADSESNSTQILVFRSGGS